MKLLQIHQGTKASIYSDICKEIIFTSIISRLTT